MEQRRERPAVPVIGLTGGIASGKSTISEQLARRGAHIIDADRVGHRVLAADGGEAYAGVVAAFGREIVDEAGEIVRARLGKVVFADPARLAELNRLVHPSMAERMRREIDKVRSAAPPPPAIVLDAAILFEAGWDPLCDEVWTVSVAPEEAVRRVVARQGLTPDEARARIAAQLGNEEREARGDRVIRNDGTLKQLGATIDELVAALAARGGAPA